MQLRMSPQVQSLLVITLSLLALAEEPAPPPDPAVNALGKADRPAWLGDSARDERVSQTPAQGPEVRLEDKGAFVGLQASASLSRARGGAGSTGKFFNPLNCCRRRKGDVSLEEGEASSTTSTTAVTTMITTGSPKVEVKVPPKKKAAIGSHHVSTPPYPGGGYYGREVCRCIGFANIKGHMHVDLKSGETVNYPAHTGSSCEAWDDNHHPECKKDMVPPWCKKKWCFVNPCDCLVPTPPKESLYLPNITFRGRPLYFSYSTCTPPGAPARSQSMSLESCVFLRTAIDCRKNLDCRWNPAKGVCIAAELAKVCAPRTMDDEMQSPQAKAVQRSFSPMMVPKSAPQGYPDGYRIVEVPSILAHSMPAAVVVPQATTGAAVPMPHIVERIVPHHITRDYISGDEDTIKPEQRKGNVLLPPQQHMDMVVGNGERNVEANSEPLVGPKDMYFAPASFGHGRSGREIALSHVSSHHQGGGFPAPAATGSGSYAPNFKNEMIESKPSKSPSFESESRLPPRYEHFGNDIRSRIDTSRTISRKHTMPEPSRFSRYPESTQKGFDAGVGSTSMPIVKDAPHENGHVGFTNRNNQNHGVIAGELVLCDARKPKKSHSESQLHEDMMQVGNGDFAVHRLDQDDPLRPYPGAIEKGNVASGAGVISPQRSVHVQDFTTTSDQEGLSQDGAGSVKATRMRQSPLPEPLFVEKGVGEQFNQDRVAARDLANGRVLAKQAEAHAVPRYGGAVAGQSHARHRNDWGASVPTYADRAYGGMTSDFSLSDTQSAEELTGVSLLEEASDAVATNTVENGRASVLSIVAQEFFTKMDKNRDTYVSADEVRSFFASVDKDGNRHVDINELFQ
eukprot:TRINITY_DN50291_c0_g1_i1.p1 TRINITY_DN50291_c0_g1~~TRINITY_DN50291_c0_g1_i1.p1  ORF type:complete len:852 (-),score=114.64 TRINITY_DN50291_c0_g1_i1:117-2672(-)